ncbi:MAG: polysaccharide biosynthesis protein [Clostridia bacterium]|nr:polysaccharide biosynthesis protein [Clostridia bacterium]
MKKQSYLKGAVILVVANALVKVIGALFKIPLANIIHEEGMAIFSTAYNLYACMFVIATAGLPVAVSKMVSASVAKNNYTETKKIFRAAITLLFLIGLAGMLVLLLGAKIFAVSVVNSPSSYLSIIAIAPAIFFVSLLSAFRGYFQGFSDMLPTALSEVAEALGKLVIGLLLAYVLFPSGIVNAAAGAVLGVTAGTFFACIIMVVTFVARRKAMNKQAILYNPQSRSARSIFAELAKLAVPITIGAAVTSLTNVIDVVMIRKQLQTISVTQDMFNTLTEFYGVSPAEAIIGNAMAIKPSEILYGAYSGFAIPMFNLPPTIIMSLSMSVVPFISGAFATKNFAEVKKLSESTLRITMLFSLPCAVGLSVLSEPILTAVYNNARAASMLTILGYAVIFVSLVSVSTAMLQAAGKVMIPVRNMAIGGVVKIVTNFILIAIPGINIGGAPISTNLCYLVITVLNLNSVRRIMGAKMPLSSFVLRPVIASGIMGVGGYFAYQLAAKFLNIAPMALTVNFMPQNPPITPVVSGIRIKMIIALGVAICVAVLLYGIMVFAFKLIRREDVLMMPKGEKLAGLLDKFRLLS